MGVDFFFYNVGEKVCADEERNEDLHMETVVEPARFERDMFVCVALFFLSWASTMGAARKICTWRLL